METGEVLKVSITCIMCCMNNVFVSSFSPLQSLMQKKQRLHSHKKTNSKVRSPLMGMSYLQEATSWPGRQRRHTQTHRRALIMCAKHNHIHTITPCIHVYMQAQILSYTHPYTHTHHFCLMFANHPRFLTACPACFQITVFIN